MSIFVCVGSACHLKGSYNLINQLQQIIEERRLGDEVVVKAALCLGHCTNAVSARVNGGEVVSLSNENLAGFFEKNVMEKLEKRSI